MVPNTAHSSAGTTTTTTTTSTTTTTTTTTSAPAASSPAASSSANMQPTGSGGPEPTSCFFGHHDHNNPAPPTTGPASLTEEQEMIEGVQEAHLAAVEKSKTDGSKLIRETTAMREGGDGLSLISSSNTGATVETPGYKIVLGEKKASLDIYDRESGERLTRIWGDPHVIEGDGDKYDFYDRTSFILPDGTKVSIETKDYHGNNSGATLSDNITISNGEDTIEVNNLAYDQKRGDVTVTEHMGDGKKIDADTSDGNTIFIDEKGDHKIVNAAGDVVAANDAERIKMEGDNAETLGVGNEAPAYREPGGLSGIPDDTVMREYQEFKAQQLTEAVQRHFGVDLAEYLPPQAGQPAGSGQPVDTQPAAHGSMHAEHMPGHMPMHMPMYGPMYGNPYASPMQQQVPLSFMANPEETQGRASFFGSIFGNSNRQGNSDPHRGGRFFSNLFGFGNGFRSWF